MSEHAITTKGLSRRFGSRWVVKALDLEIPRGSVYGLLGPNGAGKSTTIKMLMGLLPPSSGEISVLGLDPTRADVAVRPPLGDLSQIP